MPTIKKKATSSEQERLAKSPFPLPRFVKGAKVQVYLGAGWSTGSVVSSHQDRCQVALAIGNRTITVFDARFVRIPMLNTQQEIVKVCDSIKNLLLDKNKKYGDSALNPNRIFSKASSVEQIFVRIDDKLSRISKGAGLVANDEDVINDLIGYLVLLKIALKQQEDKWDGSDIEPDLKSWEEFWNTPTVSKHKRDTSKLNDTEWLDLYASGDKFG
jgi:hypothetical protein